MGRVLFSYSRLSGYDKCPFKYKLHYEDRNFIDMPSLANELGTLIHWIEEQISLSFLDGKKPDYTKLLNDFYNINNPKTSPGDMDNGQFGINILKEKYQDDFYDVDENGDSYFRRCEWYAKEGIYRQEQFIKAHPSYKLVDVEKYFEFNFEGNIIKGYIDRIWFDEEKKIYIIDDIKTKKKLFDEKETKTPLQHCIYAMALKEAYGLKEEPTAFYYDLPFVNTRQPLGTIGCIKRAKTKLKKIFDGINSKEWSPKPGALCYWCEYSGTNPKQPPEGRHKCCYYSLWTPKNNKCYEKMNEWKGMEEHEKVMKKFLEDQCYEGSTVVGPNNEIVKNFDIDF